MELPVSDYCSVVGLRDSLPLGIQEYLDDWVREAVEGTMDGELVFYVLSFVCMHDVVCDEDLIEFGAWRESDVEI